MTKSKPSISVLFCPSFLESNMNLSLDHTKLNLQTTLQRLIGEGKTIRQIARAFDQEVANTRVELYNSGVPEKEIQRRLMDLNKTIDDLLASTFPRQYNPLAAARLQPMPQFLSMPTVYPPQLPISMPSTQLPNPPMQPMGFSLSQTLPAVMRSTPREMRMQLIERSIGSTMTEMLRDKSFVMKPYPQEGWSDMHKLDYLKEEIEESASERDDATADAFQLGSLYANAYIHQAALALMLSLDPSFEERQVAKCSTLPKMKSHVVRERLPLPRVRRPLIRCFIRCRAAENILSHVSN